MIRHSDSASVLQSMSDARSGPLAPNAPLPADFYLSPSLQALPPAKRPACEMKFLVTEDQAQRIESLLRSDFLPDPHTVNLSPRGGYQTTTVYCDTPNFDTYFRRGPFRRRKYRLRRYGLADQVFLEQKSKRGLRVRKERSAVAWNETPRLRDLIEDADWAGDWFQKRVFEWSLAPVLAVRYRRTAYVGRDQHGPLRLTFDREIAGKRVDHWYVAPFTDGETILAESVVCEFKFQGALPGCFKRVIEDLQLTPAAASKYRRCLDAVGGPDVKATPHA